MKNKISVVMVCKNSEDTIELSLNSFLNQSLKHKELIVIDGGSTDNTVNLIKKYKNINYFEVTPGLGLYASINYAIKMSTGNIIGILHSDDIFFSKNILTNISNEFSEDIDAIYSNIKFTDKFGEEKRSWISENLNREGFQNLIFPPHTGIYIKKKIFEIVGPYDETYKISSDQEFMYKLFYLNNFNIKFCDLFTIKMKLGGLSTKSLKNIIIANYETLKILNKYNKNVFKNLLIIMKKLAYKLRQ